MCTIIGVSINTKTIKDEKLLKVIKFIFSNYNYRGRDYYGFVDQNLNIIKTEDYYKFKKEIEEKIFSQIELYDKYTFLIQSRAVPETEPIKIDEKFIQPIITKNLVFTHNGLIYNDKELKIELNIDVENCTDSYILANYEEKYGIEKTVEKANGSYSCVFFYKDCPNILYYMVNYQPLYVSKDNDYILLTNFPMVDFNYCYQQIEPYTYGYLKI